MFTIALKRRPTDNIQIEQSDVISFHNYGGTEDFKEHIKLLEQFCWSLICAEYTDRPVSKAGSADAHQSTFSLRAALPKDTSIVVQCGSRHFAAAAVDEEIGEKRRGEVTYS